ncbi:hypothetical protein Vadar_019264 [Vaccinium darrowii]|uniref:Uncharacterized protein n=1 Tax=Vaccinium darrowii TaxID=229202 RepID=A0ACB7XJ05_9ERIC|nr:hypothetical protein Vadar_019264 [Vaccinium darrowii]
MHRDVATHVAVSTADFFITGSADGHLKFWKKKALGIEFAKHFRSHLGPIEGLASTRLLFTGTVHPGTVHPGTIHPGTIHPTGPVQTKPGSSNPFRFSPGPI